MLYQRECITIDDLGYSVKLMIKVALLTLGFMLLLCHLSMVQMPLWNIMFMCNKSCAADFSRGNTHYLRITYKFLTVILPCTYTIWNVQLPGINAYRFLEFLKLRQDQVELRMCEKQLLLTSPLATLSV